MWRSLKTIIWMVTILLFCWLMLRLSIPYFGFRHDVDFLLTKQKIIHIKLWRYAFYVHVFLSIFSLIAGLTQFLPRIHKHNKKLHRIMGYIYAIDVVCLAGPSGLIMAFYANGTIVSKTSFVILSALWIFTTVVAMMKIFRKDFRAHEKWMIRSYALTLSAISLRLMAMVLPVIVQLNAHEEYALLAWLSWTINLAIAECIIYFKKL